MSGPWRHAELGTVDRGQPLRFSFDGRSYTGFAGDTLASALLGAGVRLVGRSFKYHRPRGIMAAGAEEPNALVRLGRGQLAEPNTQATRVELEAGLVAQSQHCWPSLGFDAGAVIGLLKPFMPAGFYYKTFIGQRAWHLVEPFIRQAAGFGRVPEAPDPERYEHRHAHTDVAVVGAGPSGRAAARAAARAGARVLLIDDGAIAADLEGEANLSLLGRTTVVGYYHNNFLLAAERCRGEGAPRLRLWHLGAAQVVLATGAYERPLTFPDNDRPGIMLAGAVRTYLERYGVVSGRRAVVFTNNDGAYDTAFALAAAGAEVAALVDRRESVDRELAGRLGDLGIAHHVGQVVTATRGRGGLSGIRVRSVGDIDCDLLAMSGGWTPAVHLHSQCGGRLSFRDGAFVPDGAIEANRSVGACNGRFDLVGCLDEGARAGAAAASDAGFGDGSVGDNPEQKTAAAAAQADWNAALEPPLVAGQRGRQFVDIQMDVTVADIELAARENYVSVEHLKRYTTLGMGLDQGRTSNLPGLAALAMVLGTEPGGHGTTTFRPPYLPTTIGAIVGRGVGELGYPPRRTAAHEWHIEHGAVIVEAGWQRPQCYRHKGEGGGESILDAVKREVGSVRAGAGLVDVTTLGKIDIQGPDACEFLNRIYTNGWKTLAVGRSRYGLMLRDDGRVFDDGVTSRLGDSHYHMTTTTANAEAVLRWMEFLLQVRWPELRVYLAPVTEQWFAAALTGPGARDILAPLTDVDVGREAFPYMSFREGTVLDIPARLFRMSFTGELTFEINVAADQGLALWRGLMAAGAEAGLIAYGTESMGVMRIEKGHVAGPELAGQTTPGDIGMARMVSSKKACVGQRSLSLPALVAAGRKQLVGLEAVAGVAQFPPGSQIVGGPGIGPQPILGYVTSHAFSPTFGHPIALALVAGGHDRHGEELYVSAPTAGVSFKVRVRDNHFYDPDGERLDG